MRRIASGTSSALVDMARPSSALAPRPVAATRTMSGRDAAAPRAWATAVKTVRAMSRSARDSRSGSCQTMMIARSSGGSGTRRSSSTASQFRPNQAGKARPLARPSSSAAFDAGPVRTTDRATAGSRVASSAAVGKAATVRIPPRAPGASPTRQSFVTGGSAGTRRNGRRSSTTRQLRRSRSASRHDPASPASPPCTRGSSRWAGSAGCPPGCDT